MCFLRMFSFTMDIIFSDFNFITLKPLRKCIHRKKLGKYIVVTNRITCLRLIKRLIVLCNSVWLKNQQTKLFYLRINLEVDI